MTEKTSGKHETAKTETSSKPATTKTTHTTTHPGTGTTEQPPISASTARPSSTPDALMDESSLDVPTTTSGDHPAIDPDPEPMPHQPRGEDEIARRHRLVSQEEADDKTKNSGDNDDKGSTATSKGEGL